MWPVPMIDSTNANIISLLLCTLTDSPLHTSEPENKSIPRSFLSILICFEETDFVFSNILDVFKDTNIYT